MSPLPPKLDPNSASSFDYAAYAWQDILVALDPETGVLLVTLNRPASRNAFTVEMAINLVLAFRLADLDDRVKSVVVTGAGSTFCAGADLSGAGFGEASQMSLDDHRDPGGMVVLAMLNCCKLIVAAVNGNAVGIGLTMTAKLGTPFVKRGISCDAVSSYLLPRLIGHSNATRILLTGDLHTCGDVRSPVAPLFAATYATASEVLPAAVALALRLTRENSLVSMALVKSQLWRPGAGLGGQLEAGVEEAFLHESKALAWVVTDGDALEGVMSFMQKRKPNFQSNVRSLRESGWWPWWRTKDVSSKKTSKL
ncbi:hypothetical protein HK405_007314 [Cladochytrium tenue]|nr:hypothetical protein HK405_007314 [Cladochytrium tenue]